MFVKLDFKNLAICRGIRIKLQLMYERAFLTIRLPATSGFESSFHLCRPLLQSISEWPPCQDPPWHALAYESLRITSKHWLTTLQASQCKRKKATKCPSKAWESGIFLFSLAKKASLTRVKRIWNILPTTCHRWPSWCASSHWEKFMQPGMYRCKTSCSSLPVSRWEKVLKAWDWGHVTVVESSYVQSNTWK